MRYPSWQVAALLGLVLVLGGCGPAGGTKTEGGTRTEVKMQGGGGESPRTTSGPANLRGGGSSFVKPIMDKWVAEYKKAKGGTINYQPTASGAGVRSMTDRSVDFGCTDAFMTDEELKNARDAKDGGEVLHIPLVMGGLVPAYNLPEADKPLNFTGEVLAKIYLGKITRWNDVEIKRHNPEVALPDKEIAPVHRSDSSGSTNIFTEYLSKVSEDWKPIGFGTTVEWKVGPGAEKTAGVAGFIKKNPYSLGYVELTYALQSDLKFGAVRNRAGQFVSASLPSVAKAAENSLGDKFPADLRYSITDAPGDGSYPISGTTWAVLYVNQPGEKAGQLADFFTWVVHDGQKYTEEKHYAPLPQGLVQRIDEKLKQIQSK